MITTLISVGAIALLFMIAAVMRPRVGCGGHCDSCAHACNSVNGDGQHVA